MAEKHCSVLAEHPQADLKVICSTERSRGRGETFREQFGFTSSGTDFQAMLDDRDLEVIYICSPDSRHVEQTIAALEAGKHVFCEKPLARTRAEFDRLERTLERAGTVLGVGMNCRYRAQYSGPRERIASGQWGRLQFLRGVYLHNLVPAARNRQKPWWLEHPEEVYFFLHGNGIHCIDLMRWVGGEVDSVFARSSGFELGSDFKADTFSASISFTSGAIGEMFVSTGAYVPREISLQAWLSQASLVGSTLYRREQGDQGEELPVLQPHLDLWLQFDDLVAAIEANHQPMNSLAEAYRNFEVIEALQRSLRSGQAVELG